MLSIILSGAELLINEIAINNFLGQTIYHELPTVNCKLIELNVSSFAPGMYVVKINCSDGWQEVRKFVKE